MSNNIDKLVSDTLSKYNLSDTEGLDKIISSVLSKYGLEDKSKPIKYTPKPKTELLKALGKGLVENSTLGIIRDLATGDKPSFTPDTTLERIAYEIGGLAPDVAITALTGGFGAAGAIATKLGAKGASKLAISQLAKVGTKEASKALIKSISRKGLSSQLLKQVGKKALKSGVEQGIIGAGLEAVRSPLLQLRDTGEIETGKTLGAISGGAIGGLVTGTAFSPLEMIAQGAALRKSMAQAENYLKAKNFNKELSSANIKKGVMTRYIKDAENVDKFITLNDKLKKSNILLKENTKSLQRLNSIADDFYSKGKLLPDDVAKSLTQEYKQNNSLLKEVGRNKKKLIKFLDDNKVTAQEIGLKKQAIDADRFFIEDYLKTNNFKLNSSKNYKELFKQLPNIDDIHNNKMINIAKKYGYYRPQLGKIKKYGVFSKLMRNQTEILGQMQKDTGINISEFPLLGYKNSNEADVIRKIAINNPIFKQMSVDDGLMNRFSIVNELYHKATSTFDDYLKQYAKTNKLKMSSLDRVSMRESYIKKVMDNYGKEFGMNLYDDYLLQEKMYNTLADEVEKVLRIKVKRIQDYLPERLKKPFVGTHKEKSILSKAKINQHKAGYEKGKFAADIDENIFKETDPMKLYNRYTSELSSTPMNKEFISKAIKAEQQLRLFGYGEYADYFNKYVTNSLGYDKIKVGKIALNDATKQVFSSIEDVVKFIEAQTGEEVSTSVLAQIYDTMYNSFIFANPLSILKQYMQNYLTTSAEVGVPYIGKAQAKLFSKEGKSLINSVKNRLYAIDNVFIKETGEKVKDNLIMKIVKAPGRPGKFLFTKGHKNNVNTAFLAGYLKMKEQGFKGMTDDIISSLRYGQKVNVMDAFQRGGLEEAAKEFGITIAHRGNFLYTMFDKPLLMQTGAAKYLPFMTWGRNQLNRIIQSYAEDGALLGTKDLAKRIAIPASVLYTLSQIVGVDMNTLNMQPLASTLSLTDAGLFPFARDLGAIAYTKDKKKGIKKALRVVPIMNVLNKIEQAEKKGVPEGLFRFKEL